MPGFGQTKLSKQKDKLTQEEKIQLMMDPYGMAQIHQNSSVNRRAAELENMKNAQIMAYGFKTGDAQRMAQGFKDSDANNKKTVKKVIAKVNNNIRPGRPNNAKRLAEERKNKELSFDDYTKEMELLDFMARQKATNDLPELHKQLQAMSKVDTSVKTPEGKTRVWNANGDSYLIDSGNRAQLSEARNKQYNPGNIAAMGSDFKNNQSVVTSVNPVTQQPNAWVKPQQSFDSFYRANIIDDNMAVEKLPADVNPWGENPGFRWKVGGNRIEGDGLTRIEGDGFWAADTDSDFWKTDAGAAKAVTSWPSDDGSLPSFVKQPKQQEIDIQGIKNWFSENWGK